MFDRMKHGMMFRFFADDMTAAVHSAAGESEHGQVARFGPTAGENDFVRLGVKQRGDFIARIIDRCSRVTPGAMNTRRIPKMLTEIRQHRFARGIAKWRGRVVIEVDHSLLNSSWLLVGFFFRFGTMRSWFSS